MAAITPLLMPKWGLSMQEGSIVHWWKQPGDAINPDDDLVDIETSKITNVAPAPAGGVLRRIVAGVGETLPVGALIGVLADPAVADDDIEQFVAAFQASFVPPDTTGESADALALSTVQVGPRIMRIGQVDAEGEPSVLIHGFSGDLTNWTFNLEALAERGPVLAIDLPGHGGSSKDVGDGSLSTLAGIMADVLQQLAVGPAHLVGHSLGAAVATRLAIDHPDLVKSLTLICPVGLPGSSLSETFLTGVIEAERPRDLRPVLEELMADGSRVTREMVEAVVKAKRVDGAEEALTVLRDRMVEGSDFEALRNELSQIAQAHVISTRADRIAGVPDGAALPPGWRVTFVEDAGHMPHVEQSAKVNALLVAT